MDDTSTPVQAAQDEPVDEFDALEQFFSTKWILDGITSLANAAEQLREFAGHLDDLVSEGFELRDAIDGGVGYYARP